MDEIPTSLRPLLRRLRRRLGIGLFLEIWPAWAIASLVATGTVAIVCRMFVPRAAPFLPWLWLLPVVTAAPVAVICWRRAYRPGEVAALADSLGGGQGLLLALFEKHDAEWALSPLLARASAFAMPRFQLRRTFATLLSAAAFMAVSMMLPQRVDEQTAGAVAELMAADLKAAVVALKQQELITPEEEKRFEEEIERLRQGAEERVDAAAWEASDAMRERMVANLSEKQAAVKWAQDSLARFSAAAAEGGAGDSSAAAQAAELTKALEKLAKSGMLAGAPPGLRSMLNGGKLPTDPAALAQLAASLEKYLGEANGRFGELAGLGPGLGGRFNPAEFPLASGSSLDGDGQPGRGGVNRGRGDADLTLGEQTALFDRFKSNPLPPGAPRTPDDWTPVVSLPGAPQEAPVLSGPAAARHYSAGAGQEAWRRSLAPRHQSAVKKYFGPATDKKGGGQEQNRN